MRNWVDNSRCMYLYTFLLNFLSSFTVWLQNQVTSIFENLIRSANVTTNVNDELILRIRIIIRRNNGIHRDVSEIFIDVARIKILSRERIKLKPWKLSSIKIDKDVGLKWSTRTVLGENSRETKETEGDWKWNRNEVKCLVIEIENL